MAISKFCNIRGIPQFLVEDEPFTMLCGELHNSSASSLEYMRSIWPKLERLNLNSVLAPVSWELMEPEEGHYDFSLVDELIQLASGSRLKLGLLWFATWKNAESTYTPEWVKTDPARFPRARLRDGRITRAVSCFSDQCRAADARAFAALMAHLRSVDKEGTVILMQVENEVGLLGSGRDHSPLAKAAFDQQIPKMLAQYLWDCVESLNPILGNQVRATGLKGTWAEAFGPLADEAFMAYYTARYIEKVAGAGKQEYPLPLFVNAWTQQYPLEPGGMHPSGGPVAYMHPIWRFAAPSIDALAPDLYLENFKEECAAYTRLEGNPLIIPELRRDRWAVGEVFYALGQHRAVCVSPFGIDSLDTPAAIGEDALVQQVVHSQEDTPVSGWLQESYGLLRGILPMLQTHPTQGILQDVLPTQMLAFGNYLLQVSFAEPPSRGTIPGGGLVMELGEGDFLIAGVNLRIRFHSQSGSGVEYLSVEEGRFQDGLWIRRRRLNGDELGVWIDAPALIRARVFTLIDS